MMKGQVVAGGDVPHVDHDGSRPLHLLPLSRDATRLHCARPERVGARAPRVRPEIVRPQQDDLDLPILDLDPADLSAVVMETREGGDERAARGRSEREDGLDPRGVIAGQDDDEKEKGERRHKHQAFEFPWGSHAGRLCVSV